jgi:hypothetical protein
MLLVAWPGFSQITGELRGVITDPSGLAVPNAKVKLQNVETGVTREQTVADEGGFSFNLLQIGRYEIKRRLPASGRR